MVSEKLTAQKMLDYQTAWSFIKEKDDEQKIFLDDLKERYNLDTFEATSFLNNERVLEILARYE